MKILLILECSKIALKRSRRIASKYLNQIGRRTYLNDISNKALQMMYDELKSVTSKNNAIVCYRLTRTQKEIVFKLGSQKNFSEEGFFVYKNKEIPKEFKMSFVDEYLCNLTSIAGYFHDIGKANKGFQAALRYSLSSGSGVMNDYRHEYVSFYMLYNYFYNTKIWNSAIDEKSLIRNIINSFDTLEINDFLKGITSVGKKNFKCFQISSFQKFPVLNSILWLVLTHHKLVNNKSISENDGKFFDFKKYDRISSKQIDDKTKDKGFENFKKNNNIIEKNNLNIFLDFDSNHLEFFQDTSFIFKIKSCFQYLFENYENFLQEISYNKDETSLTESFNKSKLPAALTLICRPALVYSDYYSSSIKKACDKSSKDIAYANTTATEDGSHNVLADSLLTHLKYVGDNVKKEFTLLLDYKKFEDFRHLDKGLKECLKPAETISSVHPKFMWQDIAAEKLKSRNITDKPFFGILMAGTGCGKTRACAKIMNALTSDKLRFSVALGLKTLSCQTEKEYVNEIFNTNLKTAKKEVSLLVGPCLQNIEEKAVATDNPFSYENFENYDEVANFNGSISEGAESQNSEDDSFQLNSFDVNNYLLKPLCKNNKQKSLVYSPIVVMTIDHVIKVIQQQNSVNLTLLTRIISSDFVIDEIDDYDAKDLVSIAVLIYILGYFGKKVLISSATVTPDVSKTLFDYYQRGVKDNYKEHKIIEYAFINELETECYSLDLNEKRSLNKFSNNYDTFVEGAANAILNNIKDHSKHNLGLLDINKSPDMYKDILNGCVDLHNDNYINYEKDGKKLKISLGFVKFNNVKSSQKFSISIDKYGSTHEFSNYQFAWINYHSKFVNLERYFIENWLDTNMKRKVKLTPDLHSLEGSEKLFRNEFFENLIQTAINEDRENIILILSTTNIIEVGRDHDYDWAILESTTSKSLVQSIGRVQRHRQVNVNRYKDNGHKNVLIMNGFIKQEDSSNTEDSYMAFPGIQTDKYNTKVMFPAKNELELYGGKKVSLQPVLDIHNKFANITKATGENSYVYSQPDFVRSFLYNHSFIDTPCNAYLINDFYKDPLSIEQEYKSFRILCLEKIRYHYYLNSDSYPVTQGDSSSYSGRYYLDSLNKNYFPKICSNFFESNRFRSQSGGDATIYLLGQYKDIDGSNNILFNQSESCPRILQEVRVNGKNYLSDPVMSDFYHKMHDTEKGIGSLYFFKKDSIIKYNDMYLSLINDNNFNLKILRKDYEIHTNKNQYLSFTKAEELSVRKIKMKFLELKIPFFSAKNKDNYRYKKTIGLYNEKDF